eukprot:symbB.v1.2.036495.t2/scaffold5169.1/size30165/1
MTHSTFKANEAPLEKLRNFSAAQAFGPLLQSCGEKGAKELEKAELLTCDAGSFAIPPQSRAKHLLLLLEGDLAVEMQNGVASSESRISPGNIIGELSILTDKASYIHYRCISKCVFAALSRRTASWLHRVDACLDFLTVEGSSCLYRQGDQMSGFFMVLSGRLVALEKVELDKAVGFGRSLRHKRQTDRVTDLLQRGRLCGELDCLRKSAYSQTVRACRDSELCRVSPTLLQLIAMDFPQAILHFSSYIGSRSPQQDVSSAKYKTTITVVPATPDVDIGEVCSNLTSALSKLGKTMHISPSTDLFFSPGLKGSARSLDDGRLGRLLADMEAHLRNVETNLNDAVFRSDDELVDEGSVYVASSTRAAGTSGTSDSDTSNRLSMAAHVSGTCWPCVFYPTTRGCMRGDRCAYCHFNHPITMLERRVRKRTRDKIKRKLSEILNPPVDLEEVHEELQTEAARVLIELDIYEARERNRWLVYEAEPNHGASITDWTKRCVRQADHILVATNFNGQGRGDVPQTPNEKHVQDAAPLYVTRELLLLHKGAGGKASKLASMDDWFVGSAAHADALKPGVSGFVRHHLFVHKGRKSQRSTRHYLNQRPWARRWHHVRLGPEDARDWARVARLLAGKAVGVCFGGGGARGNVHFGVIQAMQELGIPIDVVSGTSFGALAAAMYAISAPEPSSLSRVVKRVMTTQFSTRKLLMDLTFPRTANFTGAFLNAMLKDIFARRRCEDLLIPFSCTSTDIVQFEEKVHRDGPLWRVVRASMSLVGIAPPLPHQERKEDGKVSTTLLVDGGYSNQYPIEVLKEHGAGTVICVECCPDYSPVCTDYGDAERLMYLVEALKDPHRERASLVISPDVSPYGLLDMPKYEEIIQLGYNTARVALGQWLADEAPESIREIIRATREEEEVVAKSINEVEYGSRLNYATWRKNATRVARKLLKRRSRAASADWDGADYEAESEG